MKRLLLAALLLTSATFSSLRAEEGKVAAGNLTFTLPATSWKEVPSSSSMRAATLQIPVEGAEQPLEVVFFYFGGGQGGDTNANVQRWLGQFQSPPESKTEELEAGDKKVTLVTATGTFMDGPMMAPKTPKANYTLLGAIVPGPEANVFVKLTGPKDAVAKIAGDFKKLVTSPFASK
ncbi:MAG TPA: hypothetical protein VD994_03605 [Prosthecobacter sp.]|nr:hypothetical protein [Prosthecobacter sp.]